jgi:hypothetical protein
MNEYDIFYALVSSSSVSRAEAANIGSYQDVVNNAIEYLTNSESYDGYEAQTLVNNSFNRSISLD